jgi:LPS-assembly lipoprotein
MKLRAALLAFGLASVLAACGFQPVYAPSRLASGGGAIEVNEMPGRGGYMLRRALQRELATGLPGISGPAVLDIELDDDLTRLTFTPDGAASRATVIAKGKYALTHGEDVLEGAVNAETSFAVPDAPFGDIAAQTSATDRAMGELARKIADDMRLKLITKTEK